MVTPIFTKKEAAEKLKISVTTIDRLVLTGKLKSTKVCRKRMFTEKHLNELIENGEV
jgi:excisionase family DNA binding protein